MNKKEIKDFYKVVESNKYDDNGFNRELLKIQKVTEDQYNDLLHLHKSVNKLLDVEEELIKSNSLKKETAKCVKELLTNIEFEMQDRWNFKQDINYHIHWLKLRGCSCPKTDNKERVGSGYYVTDSKCIYHGD